MGIEQGAQCEMGLDGKQAKLGTQQDRDLKQQMLLMHTLFLLTLWFTKDTKWNEMNLPKS